LAEVRIQFWIEHVIVMVVYIHFVTQVILYMYTLSTQKYICI